MSIIEQINELDSKIDESVVAEEYSDVVSSLESLYAKHLKKNQICMVENGDIDDCYPSSYTDSSFIFESGCFTLDDSKAQEVKDEIIRFCSNSTEEVYPYPFDDLTFLEMSQCCQVFGSGGRGNCNNGHPYAEAFFFKNIKLAHSHNDYHHEWLYVENETLISYGKFNLEVFYKYNKIFNDHFDELTLIDFIF